jgi:hypothetical protein
MMLGWERLCRYLVVAANVALQVRGPERDSA